MLSLWVDLVVFEKTTTRTTCHMDQGPHGPGSVVRSTPPIAPLLKGDLHTQTRRVHAAQAAPSTTAPLIAQSVWPKTSTPKHLPRS